MRVIVTCRERTMFSLDRLHDPGTAIGAVGISVIALIVASYPIIKMIGWWMDGGVEPLLAMLSISMYLVLVVFMAAAPAVIAAVIFLIIVASAIAAPILGQVSEQVQHNRIDSERMTSYARALEENPMNAAARMALAEALYKKGQMDLAIEHMEWTLQQFPALSMRIRPELDSWKRDRQRIGVAQPIYCHRCQGENHPECTHCVECGAPFGRRAGMKLALARHGGPKMVIRAWITTASVLILALTLLAIMPIQFAAPIILASVIVGAWLFLRWAGGDMGTVGY